MTNQLDIANRALLSIGARTKISSLNPSDGSVEADACSTLFQPCFEQLGRTAPWNCLKKQVALSLIQAAQGTPENVTGLVLPLPPIPWLYSYSYPSDCLLFREILPPIVTATGINAPLTTINNMANIVLPNGGAIPYAVGQIFDNTGTSILAVLTNQEAAFANYNTNNNNPALWDSLFQSAMVATLAAFLVPALSLSLGLMDRAIKIAETAIAQARTMDGREGVTVMDHLPDWMRARAGGPGLAGFDYLVLPSGFAIDMTWPAFGD